MIATRPPGGMLLSLVRIVAIAAALATLVMAGMFAINAAVFSRGQSAVTATLQQAIADGSILATRHPSPLRWLRSGGNSGWPLYSHDCLIWTTLVAPGLDAGDLAMRTIRVQAAQRAIDPRVPANPDCQAVLQIVQPDPAAQAQPVNVPYDRYIIGQRTLAQLLLSNLSLGVSTLMIHAAVYLAFLAALVLAWRRRAVAAVVVIASLLLFYGLSYYGGMLWFASLDITHALFIVAALLVPPGAATLTACAIIGGLYGAFVAQFEVLTGGIPMAFALIALLVGASAPDQRTFVRNVSAMVVAFCVAFVGCFVIRLALLSLIDGVNHFAHHAPALFHRLRGDLARETPAESWQQFVNLRDHPFGPLLYLVRLYQPWTRLIGWGSGTFGSLLVVAGLAALIFATIRTALPGPATNIRWPPQLMGAWLALAFLVGWVAVFWSHTLVHPFFMARVLVIPVMCGAVAIAAMWSELRRRATTRAAV